MLCGYFGAIDFVNLAHEHHKFLIEEAQRQRWLACRVGQERPLRWRGLLRRLRYRMGDLLVYCGQRLKADAANTAWG